MRNSVILFVFLCLTLTSFAQTGKYSKVSIDLAGKNLVDVGSLGIAAEEGFMNRDGKFVSILSDQELGKLVAAGFPYEVLIDDYSAFVVARNQDLMQEITRINQSVRNGSYDAAGSYAVPQGFELGIMGGFYNSQQVYEEMDSLTAQYPDLVSPRTQMGTQTSIEGRPLYYFKISDNPNVNEDEPRVFYNGLIHAREGMGMQQLFFFMNYLLENYETNEEVQYLVDNVEMYFLPLFNIDGYKQNELTHPYGGGMWRKNKRNNGDGTYGVDLNRNWGYQWGYDDSGSSPIPGDITYRGTAPFSEPETQIVRDFCNEKDFKLVHNYHSHSDLLLFPWGYITELTPDSTIFQNFAELLIRDNQYIFGTPGHVLYNTNGDANDWMYGDITLHPKVFPFVPELGNEMDGFWPPVSRIIPIAQENMLSNLLLAHLSYRYAEAREENPVIIGEHEGYFRFTIKRYGLDNNGVFTVSIQPLDSAQIIATGDPVVFSGLALLGSAVDSIAYTLSPELEAGTKFRFLLQVNNGFYTHSDTITKYFGPPLVIFSDPCDDFSNWTSTKWNSTQNTFFSPPGSITDSPLGNYGLNEINDVTLNNAVDLLDSPVAVVEYMTRWDTEKGYDFVQVKATSGINWIPLAGKYTHAGTENELPGQPLYDGVHLEWVQEQIVTENYENEDIKIRFTLDSDGWQTGDGFYFDDFRITIIDMDGVGSDTPGESDVIISGPYPNPATSTFIIGFTGSQGHGGYARIEILDVRGVVVKHEFLETSKGNHTFNTRGLEPGVYFIRITGKDIQPVSRKLIIIE